MQWGALCMDISQSYILLRKALQVTAGDVRNLAEGRDDVGFKRINFRGDNQYVAAFHES